MVGFSSIRRINVFNRWFAVAFGVWRWFCYWFIIRWSITWSACVPFGVFCVFVVGIAFCSNCSSCCASVCASGGASSYKSQVALSFDTVISDGFFGARFRYTFFFVCLSFSIYATGAATSGASVAITSSCEIAGVLSFMLYLTSFVLTHFWWWIQRFRHILGYGSPLAFTTYLKLRNDYYAHLYCLCICLRDKVRWEQSKQCIHNCVRSSIMTLYSSLTGTFVNNTPFTIEAYRSISAQYIFIR